MCICSKKNLELSPVYIYWSIKRCIHWLCRFKKKKSLAHLYVELNHALVFIAKTANRLKARKVKETISVYIFEFSFSLTVYRGISRWSKSSLLFFLSLSSHAQQCTYKTDKSYKHLLSFMHAQRWCARTPPTPSPTHTHTMFNQLHQGRLL